MLCLCRTLNTLPFSLHVSFRLIFYTNFLSLSIVIYFLILICTFKEITSNCNISVFLFWNFTFTYKYCFTCSPIQSDFLCCEMIVTVVNVQFIVWIKFKVNTLPTSQSLLHFYHIDVYDIDIIISITMFIIWLLFYACFVIFIYLFYHLFIYWFQNDHNINVSHSLDTVQNHLPFRIETLQCNIGS
jgi:hypothetical protein